MRDLNLLLLGVFLALFCLVSMLVIVWRSRPEGGWYKLLKGAFNALDDNLNSLELKENSAIDQQVSEFFSHNSFQREKTHYKKTHYEKKHPEKIPREKTRFEKIQRSADRFLFM